ETQELIRLVGEFLLGRPLPRQRQQGVPERRASAAAQSDQQIFEHTVVLEDAGALEGPDEAASCDLVRLKLIQQRPAIAHFALSGRKKPSKDIECGGLAGAIWPNQADDLTVADTEIHVGQGDEPAKLHRDVLDREDDLSWFATCRHYDLSPTSELPANTIPAALRLDRVQFAIQCSSAGTMPRGRTKTITIINAP